MKKVFLGGTLNGSGWRDELISMLKIDYFNPLVDDWNDEARDREIIERAKCDFVLTVITPEMKGCYAVAEVVHDSNKHPARTVFCLLEKYGGHEFDEEQFESMKAVTDLVANSGAVLTHSLSEVARHLNKYFVKIEYNPDVVECLIERDGPTVITLGRNTYKFEKNKAGHSVCLVMLKEHREYLISLGDYRIYMKHKLKKPKFTDEERDFMQEWERKGSDMFLAYVNGRMDRFNQSSSKVRAIAIEKWAAVLPDMECPIAKPRDQAEEVAFVKEWRTLNAAQFKEYVLKNSVLFRTRQVLHLEKAKLKWDKLIFSKTGEPWPLEVPV